MKQSSSLMKHSLCADGMTQAHSIRPQCLLAGENGPLQPSTCAAFPTQGLLPYLAPFTSYTWAIPHIPKIHLLFVVGKNMCFFSTKHVHIWTWKWDLFQANTSLSTSLSAELLVILVSWTCSFIIVFTKQHHSKWIKERLQISSSWVTPKSGKAGPQKRTISTVVLRLYCACSHSGLLRQISRPNPEVFTHRKLWVHPQTCSSNKTPDGVDAAL